MKKIISLLLIAGAIITAGCSKSDSGNSDNVEGYNPPDWIIGTWINDIGGNTGY